MPGVCLRAVPHCQPQQRGGGFGSDPTINPPGGPPHPRPTEKSEGNLGWEQDPGWIRAAAGSRTGQVPPSGPQFLLCRLRRPLLAQLPVIVTWGDCEAGMLGPSMLCPVGEAGEEGLARITAGGIQWEPQRLGTVSSR